MKRLNLAKYTLIAATMATGVFSSCNDFLTLYPTGQITEEEFWEDKEDLNNVVASVYKQMGNSSTVSRMIIWGEMRSDNIVVNDVSHTNEVDRRNAILYPTDASYEWLDFYRTINYCNTVLAHGDEVLQKDPSFSKENWDAIKAEMIGVRALNYFYLVRAFKNVPYVENAITTDDGVNSLPQGVMEPVALLDTLITQVTEHKDKARTKFGSLRENKGRFTRLAMYSLLADMHLWRGSMLAPHGTAKKDTARAKATADFEAVKTYADYIIKSVGDERRSLGLYDGEAGGDATTTRRLLTKYPIASNFAFFFGTLSDPTMQKFSAFVNSGIFGSGNQFESIFELQYDGVNNVNSPLSTYYFATGSSQGPKIYAGDPATFSMLTNTKDANGVRGFCFTDLRFPATFHYVATNQTVFPIVKYTATNVDFIGTPINVINANSPAPSYTFRATSSSTAGWSIYRLPEVMLMKAEAIARLGLMSAPSATDMLEANTLVNAIFARSNPGAVPSNESEYAGAAFQNYVTARMRHDATVYNTADALLTAVYNERQREFIGEGKRWFDIVRYAEGQGTTSNILTSIGFSRTLRTRLRLMDALYNPIYENQIKANPKLVQNPVWVTAESN